MSITTRLAVAAFLLLGTPTVKANVAAPIGAANDKNYEAAFQERAKWYISRIAAEDPMEVVQWANGINLGDPHKYVLPPVLARLYLNANDEKALAAYRSLMEVDKKKGDRGLYHFSAYYRTRLYFMLKDKLPRDIIDSNVYDVRHFFDILRRGGTNNQAFMHRTSGYLWTEELPEPYPGAKQQNNQQWLRNWLVEHVKKLYHVGMGEYDSSTYMTFDAASFANIYDFAKDLRMRNMARAELDWQAAALALKYFHGVNLGPEARGFAASAVNTNTDWLSWLWWNDSARPIAPDEKPSSKHATINLALSSYRVPPVIRNIATKNVQLPFEARNSKPDYYGTKASKDQEYLYFANNYAMGTLYSGETGVQTVGTILPQTTMFKVALLDKSEVHTFGATNGYHRHFPIEGRTPYDQYHQKRGAAINICYVNRVEDEKTKHRSILGVPLGIADPIQHNGWFFWQVNKAYLAARPLNGQAEFADLGLNDKTPTHRWLVSPGTLTGWVVQAGEQADYPSLRDFQNSVIQKTKLDLSQFEAARTVTFTNLSGDVLKMRHTGGPGGKPEAWTNGQALNFQNWPVYDSPYVKQDANKGVLRLTDGKQMLTIDFSGDWPKVEQG